MHKEFDDNCVLMLRGKSVCWAGHFLSHVNHWDEQCNSMAIAGSQNSCKCARDSRESFATASLMERKWSQWLAFFLSRHGQIAKHHNLQQHLVRFLYPPPKFCGSEEWGGKAHVSVHTNTPQETNGGLEVWMSPSEVCILLMRYQKVPRGSQGMQTLQHRGGSGRHHALYVELRALCACKRGPSTPPCFHPHMQQVEMMLKCYV
jgi:hypothetical protein